MSADVNHEDEAIVVTNPCGPDWEVSGRLAHTGTYAEHGQIWIYRTTSGRYVMRRKRAALRGRSHIDDAAIFENLDDLFEHLGNGADAKRIMEALGSPRRIAVT